MKTVAEVIREHKNRQNPKYEYIGVLDCMGGFERHTKPSNIKQHFENDGWLEFDTTVDVTDIYPDSTIETRHIKKYMATILECVEIISEVKTDAKPSEC